MVTNAMWDQILDSIVSGEKHKGFDGGQHTRRAANPNPSLLQNAWVCFKIGCSTWAACIAAVPDVSLAASARGILTGLWLQAKAPKLRLDKHCCSPSLVTPPFDTIEPSPELTSSLVGSQFAK